MFILLLSYRKPLEEVMENLDAHCIFLNKYYDRKKFIFSGPRNPRTGGCILCNASDETEIKEIIKEDPFLFKGIADYEVINIELTKYATGFEQFI